LNSFPYSKADPELTLRTYKIDLAGFDDAAIQEIARRYRVGEIDGQDMKAPPSSANFISHCRAYQEAQQARRKAQQARPRRVPYSNGKAPFEVIIEKALHRHRNRPIIKKDVMLDEARRMSRAGEIPVGGCWSAPLGIVYGPEQAS